MITENGYNLNCKKCCDVDGDNIVSFTTIDQHGVHTESFALCDACFYKLKEGLDD